MSDPAWMNDQIRRWRTDARVFVRECLNVTPDKWQDEALRLVSDPSTRRLALKACKGPGKTAVLAWIILWFLTCHYQSKVGCTSITEGNIDTNLWPEIYRWMKESSYLMATFTWTKSTVARKGNANWFAVKRTWPKSGDSQQQADALAGIHADDVMFVLDESGGIPQAVMVTAEAVLSTDQPGHRAIVIQAGNTTHTTGPLYRACTAERALWHVITITGDPDSPMRSPRISLQWAREEIAKYGRDNPWVMVNVLGEFPPSSINALLGVEEVERAMHRKISRDAFEWAQKRIGVDVARFGDDRTVIFPRQGAMAWKPVIMRNERTTAIAARVARGAQQWGAEMILVDDSGHWGHGVIDNMTAAGFPCVPVMYGERASNPRYKNVRTENFINMADWVKAGGVLPYMPELVPELTEITYTFIGDAFVLEDKDMLKKRLGFSPDLADALSNTFAMPEMPGETLARIKGRNRARTMDDILDERNDVTGRVMHDFDPFETR
jgi:phage terminase large subunit